PVGPLLEARDDRVLGLVVLALRDQRLRQEEMSHPVRRPGSHGLPEPLRRAAVLLRLERLAPQPDLASGLLVGVGQGLRRGGRGGWGGGFAAFAWAPSPCSAGPAPPSGGSTRRGNGAGGISSRGGIDGMKTTCGGGGVAMPMNVMRLYIGAG